MYAELFIFAFLYFYLLAHIAYSLKVSAIKYIKVTKKMYGNKSKYKNVKIHSSAYI